MRYHYEKPDNYKVTAATTHRCNHPAYSRCTLYLDGYLGLAVVQQRFNEKLKFWYWDAIDPWLVDDIFHAKGFFWYFMEHCGSPKGSNVDIYPTVTVRQMMWALRMKPLPKEPWEDAHFLHIP